MVKAQKEKSGMTSGTLLAIGIAVIAVVISFIALERTADTGQQDVLLNLESDVREIQEQDAVEGAQEGLQNLRDNLAETGDYALAQEDIARIRRDFQQSFANARENTQEAWGTVDEDLARIEEQLRQGSAEALSALDMLISNLEQEVRVDEEGG